ncbi:MAG: ABC transporter ATP-binding protein [Deltaproteobacteria bacterium]|nr:ABC transporter ATP-binding protein [Deltaproteobacteria bacterium]
MKPIIQFENVSMSFGKLEVLKSLNLSIQEGETITIIGGSGSGKSVTLKLLLGVVTPDKGRIYFEGNNIVQMKEKELVAMRKQFGVLFQGAALFDSLNVFENIAYPLYEHFKYSEQELKSIVSKKLALVGLPKSEKLMPSELSGGMKKRVGLARAIATDPKLILYDEPTTGLDPTNTQRINQLILDLKKNMKITSIVVTHDMESAFQVSDRIALLKEGKIVSVGTVEEIKNSKDRVVKDFIEGKMKGSEISAGGL